MRSDSEIKKITMRENNAMMRARHLENAMRIKQETQVVSYKHANDLTAILIL